MLVMGGLVLISFAAGYLAKYSWSSGTERK
jgi:hypothetical protein